MPSLAHSIPMMVFLRALGTLVRSACLALVLVSMAGVMLTLAIPGTGHAKTVQNDAWLYEGSDIPHDPSWVFGTLNNGLRYAVRHNNVPPGQISIRVRIDVGSLTESDDERGYAHLLEHLVFRQSKYLAEGAAISTFQRLGAAFGSDTNAETTPTQTVLKLDLPDATPASLDTAVKLLSGMVRAPVLNTRNIATDKRIVLAEMRERSGPSERVRDKMNATFYEGQLLAQRSPIGTAQGVEDATAKSVSAFYKKWYRPKNVVIIMAGDADPATLASLVKKWFGSWKGSGKAVPLPDFGSPITPPGANPENPVGKAIVMVEPETPRSITYAILRPWQQVTDNIAYNQGLMIDSLAEAIVNRRLENKARRGGSFLSATIQKQDVSRSADGTFVSITPSGANWQAAIADVRGVIADALATPPTQEEIDREAAEFDIAFKVAVEQKTLQASSRVADDLVTAIDIRETVASPDDVLAIYRSSVPLFTPQNVIDHARALFTGNVIHGLMVTPVIGEATDDAFHAALTIPAVIDVSGRTANRRKPISFATLPAIGATGRVTSQVPIGLLGIEQVEFANGVRALLWPVKDEPGRLAVKVRFGGGYHTFQANDTPYITLGELALVSTGLATLDASDLDRLSAGRKLQFQFGIDDSVFQFFANTRSEDLDDQLYLFAAKLAFPHWDANPVLRAKAAAEIQRRVYDASPQGVLNQNLPFYQHDRDPRYLAPTLGELERTTPAGFKKVWSRVLASGPIEVQIYGDFDNNQAIKALARTFGALRKRENYKTIDLPLDPVTPGPVPITLRHAGDNNQAAAVLSWPTGGGIDDISLSRQLELLSQLFSNRLLDSIREHAGASYAPQVLASWPVDTDFGGYITAAAQLTPEMVPAFFETAEKIAADLAANPPTEDELARVIEPMRQQISRAATGSAFFMYQLEGATFDSRRIEAVRTLLRDYTQTTPAAMQELAKRFLVPSQAWRLQVLPKNAEVPSSKNEVDQ